MFRLKEVLKEKKLTSSQFAQMAGIGTTALSHYLNGHTSPTLAQVERFAELLEVDVMELIRKPNPDGSYPPAPQKSKAELQFAARQHMISLCRYFHGEPTLPLHIKKDFMLFYYWDIEKAVCDAKDMYLYKGAQLEREFYLRVVSMFLELPESYEESMTTYFGHRPQLLQEMYAAMGSPNDISRR